MPHLQFQLSSPDFAHNQDIPLEFTCDGQNVNPSLKIEGIPETTQSLVLVVDDPDSPAGNFIHWIVFNLSPNTTTIAQNSLPAGSEEGINSFGELGYGGPCPHQGKHHYVFTLYALDIKLTLDQPDGSTLASAMKDHILAVTKLVGLYQRQS